MLFSCQTPTKISEQEVRETFNEFFDIVDNNIENFGSIINDDFYIFHAATKLIDNKIFSNGGRVLSIVASGNDYLECRKKVYEIANMIDWPEKYYRSDIGANF